MIKIRSHPRGHNNRSRRRTEFLDDGTMHSIEEHFASPSSSRRLSKIRSSSKALRVLCSRSGARDLIPPPGAPWSTRSGEVGPPRGVRSAQERAEWLEPPPRPGATLSPGVFCRCPPFDEVPNLVDVMPAAPRRRRFSTRLASSRSILLFGLGLVLVNTPISIRACHSFSRAEQASRSSNLDIYVRYMPDGHGHGQPSALVARASPLFTADHSDSPQISPTQRPPVGSSNGQWSVPDSLTTKLVQPAGHQKNLSPEQLLPVNAPPPQRSY